MEKVVILGAGQIGRAVFNIISDVCTGVTPFIVDSSEEGLKSISEDYRQLMDLEGSNVEEISKMLMDRKATHVINALPFFLNEKVAAAAAMAKCHYIDFTEDDVMADKVQEIYKNTGLTCAVKCGLAPGFINYIGYRLVGQMDEPESLMISVGALPRIVSYDEDHPELSYNLSWSVDGLVNEYIRPCRVKLDGIETEAFALTGQTKVILDGTEYEAAYTSGGIGSLVKELKNVPNIYYKTLRYPGHYDFIRKVVKDKNNNFEKIRDYFLEKFPFTNDDVIVVYANALGKNRGKFVRHSYANKFYGINGLTGIQSTTAGAGVAILEMIIAGTAKGIITHSTVSFTDFMKTKHFRSITMSDKKV